MRSSPKPVTTGELKMLRQAISESPHWRDVVEKMGGERALSSYCHIAKRYGLGKPHSVSSRKWTAEEVEKVREMWSAGDRVEDIARALGRTIDSIRWLVHSRHDEPGFERREMGWNFKRRANIGPTAS